MPPIVISAGISVASKRGAGALGPVVLGRASIGADGVTLTLRFSRQVTIDTGDTVTLDASETGSGIGCAYDSGSGNTHTYIISEPIQYDEVVTLDYSTIANDIEDSEGNDLANISNKAVVNNSEQGLIPALAYLDPGGNPYLSPIGEYYLAPF
jgi:hypothetical protein